MISIIQQVMRVLCLYLRLQPLNADESAIIVNVWVFYESSFLSAFTELFFPDKLRKFLYLMGLPL